MGGRALKKSDFRGMCLPRSHLERRFMVVKKDNVLLGGLSQKGNGDLRDCGWCEDV